MPDVPLDRGVYNSFSETFENDNADMMYGQSSEIDCSVGDASKLAQQEDCYAALATGMMHPVVGLLQGRKGGQWWASVNFTLDSDASPDADLTAYEQDWTEDCLVGLTEALKAASGILNTCKAQDNGGVGGSRKIRNDGKCNATLRLANTEGREPPQDMSPLVPRH
ncbi:uncharacterized protein J4E84_005722 [Alternaria hordeiaustralica]|uniref:uncharacterized protein n=1 Tax=Alternaria hordeiaustralica TaxID=1187925 RepID=UPI0020C2937A|nr:uncharacterized protein J4E84_005722 [Alternaria hordeiaustralica]KAI4686443.1 hypothetical protein J4E84_005722 [Alternaria hordeiaustralica]